jgi:3D (Asp-Asp-Asp) domain-containing protein
MLDKIKKTIKALHISINTIASIGVLCFILYLLQYNIPAVIAKIIKENTVKITMSTMQVMEFEATGYAIGKPYSVVTANGSPVVNIGYINICGSNIFTVAVDPDVIPIGTLEHPTWLALYDKDGTFIGYGTASDTGRLIKGMKIDICFSNMDEAMRFGKQTIKVARIS